MTRDVRTALKTPRTRARAAFVVAVALGCLPQLLPAQNLAPHCDGVPTVRVVPRSNPSARADDRRIPPPPPSRLVSLHAEPSPPATAGTSVQTPPQAGPSDSFPAPTDLPQLPSIPQQAEPDRDDADYQTKLRVERLRQQLDQLRHHLSERRSNASQAKPETTPAPDAIASPEPMDDAPEQTTPAVEPSAPVATSPDPPPPQNSVGESHPAPEVGTPPVPPSRTASLIKGLPSSPADRVSIADNLFAAGETISAAQIYKEIPLTELSRTESGWVRFQLANCHRRLGQIDDAKKLYRRIIVDPSLGWLQDLSKWWLDALDQREVLTKERQRIHDLVQQAEQVKHAAVTP